MATNRKARNGHGANGAQDPAQRGPVQHGTQDQGETLYERAVLGFPNYWYPACGAREVGARPLPLKLLGEPLVFLRRHGVAYAIQDECPHRGARMALGKYEFPGSNTITCRFHGMTYDVTNGACVAALTDGPDSPIVGKLRIRTYPVEERKGIVWVWMGKGAPVPIEEDVPNHILRDDTMVKHRYRTVVGNWRYHAELGADGHLPTLHADAATKLFHRQFGYQVDWAPEIGPDDEAGTPGMQVLRKAGKAVFQADYPGLGKWPPKRWWRFMNRYRYGTRKPAQGIMTSVLRLPGVLRSPSIPMIGGVYCEWYVAIDEDHYRYFQVSSLWPRNPISWLWTNLWFYLWAKPMNNGRFNSQDLSMAAAETEFEKRHGSNPPSNLYRPDSYVLTWRKLCNEYARGEVSEPAAPAREAVVASAGGSGESD